MKKITLSLVALGLTTSLFAADYYWADLKNEIDSGNENRITKSEKTENMIKKRYGVNSELKGPKQRTEESSQSAVQVGLFAEGSGSHKKTIEGTEVTMENEGFGLYIDGKLDFSGIGFVTTNIFTTAEITTSNIDISVQKKVFLFEDSPYSIEGFYVGAGLGVGFATKTGYYEKNTVVPSLALSAGYNFEDISIFVTGKVNSKQESIVDSLRIGAAYRF